LGGRAEIKYRVERDLSSSLQENRKKSEAETRNKREGNEKSIQRSKEMKKQKKWYQCKGRVEIKSDV
jgi:hypothetical protein